MFRPRRVQAYGQKLRLDDLVHVGIVGHFPERNHHNILASFLELAFHEWMDAVTFSEAAYQGDGLAFKSIKTFGEHIFDFSQMLKEK